MNRLLIIDTPRLILRGWRDSDLDSWVDLNADERVMEFFPHTYARDHARRLASLLRAALERDGFGWRVVEVKNGPAFAGVISLQPVPFQAHFTPTREIGWRFTFETWGHGYATEAGKAALDYAFTRLDWPEVVAMTSVLNIRSQRVMERLGMWHDPASDFDHPRIEEGHRLRRHVVYRIRRRDAFVAAEI